MEQQAAEQHEAPRHVVAVTGYITNQHGEVLLVRTYSRSDTWEMPGGQVEAGETLDEALCREVLEETGVVVRPVAVVGVYHNATQRHIIVTFKAEYVSGSLQTSNETQEVQFTKIDETNIEQLLTRPHVRLRYLDAVKHEKAPYRSYQVNPYQPLVTL